MRTVPPATSIQNVEFLDRLNFVGANARNVSLETIYGQSP